MPEVPDTQMIMFHVPKEGKILEALEAIALLHTHLDRTLQLTIKSLTGITVRQAVAATRVRGLAYSNGPSAKACENVVG